MESAHPTVKHQVTLAPEVWQALDLDPGDRGWIRMVDGEADLSKVSESQAQIIDALGGSAN